MSTENKEQKEVRKVKIIGGTLIHNVPVGTIVYVLYEEPDGCVLFDYNGKPKLAAPWEVIHITS